MAFIVESILRVISKIDCGHTSIIHNKSLPENYYLPLEIRIIDNSLFLFKDSQGKKILKGSVIHSINNLESTQIIQKLYSSMSSDGKNNSRKRYFANRNFSSLYHDFIENPKEFHLSFSSPDNSEIYEIELVPSISVTTTRMILNRNNSNKEDYALLRLDHFGTDRSISSFFDTIKKSGKKRLILDLRGNGGGSPESGNVLLSYLLEGPFQYFSDRTLFYPDLVKKKTQINTNSFKGHIYVIADGGSFSTTGHVLSHLKNKKNVTILGEESGGGYVCNGNPKSVILKNTRIKLNISQGIFKTSVKNIPKGRGIKPDIEIKYTIDDYIQKKDLEIEKILELILKEKKL